MPSCSDEKGARMHPDEERWLLYLLFAVVAVCLIILIGSFVLLVVVTRAVLP